MHKKLSTCSESISSSNRKLSRMKLSSFFYVIISCKMQTETLTKLTWSCKPSKAGGRLTKKSHPIDMGRRGTLPPFPSTPRRLHVGRRAKASGLQSPQCPTLDGSFPEGFSSLPSGCSTFRVPCLVTSQVLRLLLSLRRLRRAPSAKHF